MRHCFRESLTSSLLTRQICRPVLLGCNRKGKERADVANRAEELASLPVRDDERQVRLDIDRSLVSYPHGALNSLAVAMKHC